MSVLDRLDEAGRLLLEARAVLIARELWGRRSEANRRILEGELDRARDRITVLMREVQS